MGQSESLNVAISAAIFLYEILRSKTKKSIQSK
jgi:tRNA G18 (ribose-2'-O)-methylase SpoU